jgi:hypothetical protein
LTFYLLLALPPLQAITIEQAVQEALQNNPGLLAERLGIPVAETAVITARLRPNPVFRVSAKPTAPDPRNRPRAWISHGSAGTSANIGWIPPGICEKSPRRAWRIRFAG